MHTYQVPENFIPANEDLRLQKLIDYEILDTYPEKGFNSLAQLAADIFEVENAVIAFVSENQVFFKASIGKPLSSKRSESLIALAIFKNDVLVIDAEHALSPAQKFERKDFFVALPVISPDGFAIGAIAIYDEATRTATQHQINMLKQLADLVVEKLETRMAIRNTLRAQDDRLHVLIHDLKNPMTTISLQSELVGKMPNIDERAATIAGKINLQSKKMVDNLNEILSSARKEKGSFKPQKVKIDLRDILKQVTERLSPAFTLKNQLISVEINEPIEIFGDTDKLQQLFFQLFHNAVKFSHADQTITISHQTEENKITIAIRDYGVGLNAEDLERVFIKFAPLSSAPTRHENANGLGLVAAKMFIDMHKGRLWAESEGKDKGTTFFVELPIK